MALERCTVCAVAACPIDVERGATYYLKSMSRNGLTSAILLLTVLMWTVQPHILRTLAVADSASVCSSEFDKEVDSEEFDLECASDWGTRIACACIAAERYADEAAGVSEPYVLSLNHLRGPPAS
jgi:hypothetical protein